MIYKRLKSTHNVKILKSCIRSSVIDVAWVGVPVSTILVFGDFVSNKDYGLVILVSIVLVFFSLLLISWKAFLLNKHLKKNSILFLKFLELNSQEQYEFIDTISFFREPDID